MKKKLLALFLGTAMCLTTLAGCGGGDDKAGSGNNTQQSAGANDTQNEGQQGEEPGKAVSADPMTMITEGYYQYGYMVGDMHMSYFFHFYEEQPVIGKVFYAGFCMNQINFCGTYDVAETPYDYSVTFTREEQEAEPAVMHDGTAPYTVTFYDWDGNVIDSCGYDGDYLYNNMTAIAAVGGENVRLEHDAAASNEDFADDYAGEAGQIYLSYVSETDATSTIALYHNGRYLDMVNMMVEGSWTMEQTADGFNYTLTPDMDSDTAAVLAVAADKATAVYTPDGGEAVTLVNAAQAGPAAVMTLTGAAQIPGQDEGVMADILGNLYDDGTCTIIISAFGQEMPLDEGTYTMGEDGYTVTFQFNAAGEVVSELCEAGAAIQYVQAGTPIGDLDVQLVLGIAE